MNLYSPKRVAELLGNFGIHPKKSFGQNFLVDQNIIKKIIATAELKNHDKVVEIGPGLGTMTVQMAEVSKKVIAIELDNRLIPILEKNLERYDNTDIIIGDALKVDFNNIIKNEDEKQLKVVANLPYYITTPLVMKLARERQPIDRMVLMVQKEVAERFTAIPGSKNYGAISVILDFYFKAQLAFDVPNNVFYPKPKVSSSVVNLKKRDEPKIPVQDEQVFINFINKSFSSRRKTFVNNIVSIYEGSKSELIEFLAQTNVAKDARAEELSTEKFGEIFETIYNNLKVR
ncbi:16S rRNA (adenine(1518)-N(6)/adenine(1519)-N(6))-dimethyltransferase RsmA [Natranaerobius trueperi]|uniref:Ribosomal RNA small subunit methyltransferase A n=1 Tax=Natranaerobius trueperi TaxID=759412 RepID=A0A226BZX9_9FIRM|nr:16S rRNA (adenine(1518)-N(6)/adenine(1519)-N(6))-dimethyltransferase RsmA [Natranaerobius trueperi]OWZ83647.1 16S rRNA (adenine(1518)-N(6)/adenine(1519)-N(6))-dimethyltransferase [Natranaerobius trueperi]